MICSSLKRLPLIAVSFSGEGLYLISEEFSGVQSTRTVDRDLDQFKMLTTRHVHAEQGW